MTNKEIYTQLQEQFEMPIFMQTWWMEAVCAGKDWDVLLSYDEQTQEIRAALPYLFRKRLGMRYVLMPQETQIGGIWLHPAYQDDSQAVMRICEDFAAQLKALKLAYYYQHYPIGSPCPQMIKIKGYTVKKRVTYRIDDLSDMQKVEERFSKNKKRQLHKAAHLQVDLNMDVEDFYRFHSTCLAKRRKTISYTREFLLVLYRKAMRRNQCQIIRIHNADNQTLAAVLVVWDKQTLYYLIPCYDPDFKNSGASALLAAEAIRYAHKLGKQFDFEGSIIKGIANHYKQFGTTATTYYSVQKCYKPLFSIFLSVNRLRSRMKH